MVDACIPPELGVDACGTACIVAQHAGQGRCRCNWDELHNSAAAGLSGEASGSASCRGLLYPSNTIPCLSDEVWWNVSWGKATAASAAALGRRCLTHWGGVTHVTVL